MQFKYTKKISWIEVDISFLFIIMLCRNLINKLLKVIMDFIKKNKILTLMAIFAILSFVLEKAGIIHP